MSRRDLERLLAVAGASGDGADLRQHLNEHLIAKTGLDGSDDLDNYVFLLDRYLFPDLQFDQAFCNALTKVLAQVEDMGAVVAGSQFLGHSQMVMEIIDRHCEGVVSRTGLVSFVAERTWPADVKERFLELSLRELSRLRTSLASGNVLETLELLRLTKDSDAV